MTERKPRINLLGLAVIIALAAFLIFPAQARAQEHPASLAPLVEKVAPAVVNIRIVKTIKSGGGLRMPSGGEGQQMPPDIHEFFKRFFPGPQGEMAPQRKFKQRALGTGVLLDKEGYVLTNNHVVAGADEITVVLKSGKELKAEIKGRDPKTDLALIKVKSDGDLPHLPLGDSDKLRVGDWVMAVGNPFGLEHTVTAGIVSAKGRVIGAGPYDNFIQTDASINPGNSGGPLLNMDGEVVGINTAIVAHGQGIGFAIPINLAKKVMKQLREKGRVIRAWLGVYIQPVNRELAEKFGLKDSHGALVADVVKDGPADKAGLERGDVIIEFDGRTVKDSHTLPRMVAEMPVGDDVKVKVIRKGRPRTIKVELGELKDKGTLKAAAEAPGENKLGLGLQELTPDLAKQLGVKAGDGLVISKIVQGSPADEAGLRRGDVVLEAAQEKVTSVDKFNKIASKVKEGEGLLLLIQRRQGTLFVVVKTPDK